MCVLAGPPDRLKHARGSSIALAKFRGAGPRDILSHDELIGSACRLLADALGDGQGAALDNAWTRLRTPPERSHRALE
jgi:hypothetical protein